MDAQGMEIDGNDTGSYAGGAALYICFIVTYIKKWCIRFCRKQILKKA